MPDFEKMSAIRKRHDRPMLKKANVVGVGVGYKETRGEATDQWALVVLVREKLPMDLLPKQDVIPKEVDGLVTDVKSVGRVVAYPSTTDRWRPAPGGVSVGHYAITAGTLGAVVRDASTQEQLILSNNHVLANSNDASIGDQIVQPGPVDGGRVPQDVIATLERFVPIKFQDSNGGNGGCAISKTIVSVLNALARLVGSGTRFGTRPSQTSNLMDAAIAKPSYDDVLKEEIYKVGTVQGTIAAEVGMDVKKCGRTTELTTGSITTLDTTIQVGYGGNRVATFEHQILTSDMSEPGDSGSLIVDNENRAVGLLFAGSDQVTVMSPIGTVMQELNFVFA